MREPALAGGEDRSEASLDAFYTRTSKRNSRTGLWVYAHEPDSKTDGRTARVVEAQVGSCRTSSGPQRHPSLAPKLLIFLGEAFWISHGLWLSRRPPVALEDAAPPAESSRT